MDGWMVICGSRRMIVLFLDISSKHRKKRVWSIKLKSFGPPVPLAENFESSISSKGLDV